MRKRERKVLRCAEGSQVAVALHWVVSLGDEYVHDVSRLGGEHSLNGQWRYNLLCWVWAGSDAKRPAHQ